MAIVYLHKRIDNNEVFYVGIGKNEKRAHAKDGRNSHWHNVAKVSGYNVEVTHKDIIWEEACSIEKYLIAFYGRQDLKNGYLVNKTDGGDGAFGVIVSQELREKFSKIRKGQKRSEEAKANIRNAKLGCKNPSFGIKHSEEYKAKMSETLKKIKGTPENKAKVSQFHKGKVLSELHKQKISLAKKNNKLKSKQNEDA
jgi:hypothetical protein